MRKTPSLTSVVIRPSAGSVRSVIWASTFQSRHEGTKNTKLHEERQRTTGNGWLGNQTGSARHPVSDTASSCPTIVSLFWISSCPFVFFVASRWDGEKQIQDVAVVL